MIQTQALRKIFGRIVAVDAVDLSIAPGQIVGFLGPNGAGKSTTLRMICGFLPPTSGTVHVGGMDVHSHGQAVRQMIGYLPESTPLYTEMRVREYLAFRARIFGIARRDRRTSIDLALDRCQLAHVARRPVAQLSRGYRQRVGLAAALLHEPPLLILDEPTVGLDPTQIVEIRSLIRELAGRHTIIFSTHILPEVELTCDRIVMIAGGRIRADGAIDDLRAQAASRHTYVIEIKDGSAAARIGALPGVDQVAETPLADGWTRLAVRADAHVDDLRPELWSALRSLDAPVRELRRDVESLEQLFVRMTNPATMAATTADAVTP